jgi:tripartite-type tricarboxylate transporter receptor subunit TctC
LIVKNALPVKTPKDLVAYAKANAGKLNYGSPGSGSLNRLEMELFRKIAGLDMVHIPYKGGAGPAVAGIIAGEVDLMFTTASSAISHAQSGLLRPLGVSSTRRMAGLPDVPTMAESGYPDMVSSSWQGMVLPVGTPQPIVQKLYTALIATVGDDDVKKRLVNGGMDPLTSKSPEDFGQFLAAESKRWATVVQESGATPD